MVGFPQVLIKVTSIYPKKVVGDTVSQLSTLQLCIERVDLKDKVSSRLHLCINL